MLYKDMPNNLPARYLPARLFVIRIGPYEVPFFPHSRAEPVIHIVIRRRQSTRPVDLERLVLSTIRVVGWRWIAVDTHNPRTNFAALGLNIPGVAGYDPTKDHVGNPLPPPPPYSPQPQAVVEAGPTKPTALSKAGKKIMHASSCIFAVRWRFRLPVQNSFRWLKTWKARKINQQQVDHKFPEEHRMALNLEPFMRACQ
ncbi:hypothetical protein TWF696_005323 [Orbilia brochopaga]|uniref:Uncharacterized protein n=1 Tax=Orbilia brochopaga TaxID=3140254 RepID=A0AAV9V1E9_9PEZI